MGENVKKMLLIAALAPSLMVLGGCSGGSSPSIQTVQAQAGYTNASLSGTYSASLVSPFTTVNSGVVPFYSGIGTIQFNGIGSVTGGTFNIYSSYATAPCVYAATGTYSIPSTALGTATLNLTSSTKGCAATDTWQLALAAASGGSAIQFVRTDGNVVSGSAVKQ
jgi:hypothetical protein